MTFDDEVLVALIAGILHSQSPMSVEHDIEKAIDIIVETRRSLAAAPISEDGPK